MNNNNNAWYLSWPVIIIAFMCCWPVAIYLIYLRTKNSRSGAFAAATNKKMYMVLGVILFLMGMSSCQDSAGMGLFMMAGGAAMVYYANALAKKASRNKTYIDMIVNRGETSIDKISSQLNVKYDVALKELQTMQTLGILKGATIDPQTHSITIQKTNNVVGEIGGMVNSVTNTFISAASNSAAEPVKMEPKTVQAACPGCGAKYTGAQGGTVTCDYCDATIIF